MRRFHVLVVNLCRVLNERGAAVQHKDGNDRENDDCCLIHSAHLADNQFRMRRITAIISDSKNFRVVDVTCNGIA